MLPRSQRLVIKDFPRASRVLGSNSWLKIKASPNNSANSRFAVLFLGGKTTSARRHYLKRKIIGSVLKPTPSRPPCDYLFIVSGPSPEDLKNLSKDIKRILTEKT